MSTDADLLTGCRNSADSARVMAVAYQVADQFRALAAMGYTLQQARQACPHPIRINNARLSAGLRAAGVVFPETREPKRAKTYRIRNTRKTIKRAIRESGQPISPQAVRYRVNVMGWTLQRALNTPTLTRAESGRIGAKRKVEARS
jgi:hypothetical protein